MLEWANGCVALSALLVVLSDPVKGLPAVPACRSTGAISMSSQVGPKQLSAPQPRVDSERSGGFHRG